MGSIGGEMKLLVVLAVIGCSAAVPMRSLEDQILSALKGKDAHQISHALIEAGIGEAVHMTPSAAHLAAPTITTNPNGYRPVVQMHGMGDFAANPLGMVPLKKMISKWLGGAYVVNAVLGDNILSDELGSFF